MQYLTCNVKKKCPVCSKELVNLPRHMRGKHGWSTEESKNVCGTHNLRKAYTWKKIGLISKHKDCHKKRWCPVAGCLTVTVKLARQ